MGPWYSGDGPGEKYLDFTHTDTAGTPVLDVQDIFLSLNMTEPGPYVGAQVGLHRC